VQLAVLEQVQPVRLVVLAVQPAGLGQVRRRCPVECPAGCREVVATCPVAD